MGKKPVKFDERSIDGVVESLDVRFNRSWNVWESGLNIRREDQSTSFITIYGDVSPWLLGRKVHVMQVPQTTDWKHLYGTQRIESCDDKVVYNIEYRVEIPRWEPG